MTAIVPRPLSEISNNRSFPLNRSVLPPEGSLSRKISKRNLFPDLDESEKTPSDQSSIFDAVYWRSSDYDEPRYRPSRDQCRSSDSSRDTPRTASGSNASGRSNASTATGKSVCYAVRFDNRPNGTPLTTITEQKSVSTLCGNQPIRQPRPVTLGKPTSTRKGSPLSSNSTGMRRKASKSLDDGTIQGARQQRKPSSTWDSLSERIKSTAVIDYTRPASPPNTPVSRVKTPLGAPKWPGDLRNNPPQPQEAEHRSVRRILARFFRPDPQGAQTVFSLSTLPDHARDAPGASASRTGRDYWNPPRSAYGTRYNHEEIGSHLLGNATSTRGGEDLHPSSRSPDRDGHDKSVQQGVPAAQHANAAMIDGKSGPPPAAAASFAQSQQPGSNSTNTVDNVSPGRPRPRSAYSLFPPPSPPPPSIPRLPNQNIIPRQPPKRPVTSISSITQDNAEETALERSRGRSPSPDEPSTGHYDTVRSYRSRESVSSQRGHHSRSTSRDDETTQYTAQGVPMYRPGNNSLRGNDRRRSNPKKLSQLSLATVHPPLPNGALARVNEAANTAADATTILGALTRAQRYETSSGDAQSSTALQRRLSDGPTARLPTGYRPSELPASASHRTDRHVQWQSPVVSLEPRPLSPAQQGLRDIAATDGMVRPRLYEPSSNQFTHCQNARRSLRTTTRGTPGELERQGDGATSVEKWKPATGVGATLGWLLRVCFCQPLDD